jgi:hypothetical protein
VEAHKEMAAGKDLALLLIAVAILVAGAAKFTLAPGRIRNW